MATYPDRVLIEICAGHDSRLGQPRAVADGCVAVRVTVDDDLTSVEGVHKVLDLLSDYLFKPIFIWVSIPCTGGSLQQRINRSKSQHACKLIRLHIKLFISLFDSVLLIAKHCGPKCEVCRGVASPV